MSDTNVVVLTGTLGNEVKSRAFPDSGNIEAVIRLASNKYKANPQSETGFDQYTTWTTVKFRGRVAENAVNKLSRGMKITVVGELSEDVWEDRNEPGKMQRQLYISGRSFEAKQGAREKNAPRDRGGDHRAESQGATPGQQRAPQQSSQPRETVQANHSRQRPAGYNG
jgi:single stranded DNA-binding protein